MVVVAVTAIVMPITVRRGSWLEKQILLVSYQSFFSNYTLIHALIQAQGISDDIITIISRIPHILFSRATMYLCVTYSCDMYLKELHLCIRT